MSRVSSAELFVRINLFRRFIFRKNIHADFYGLSDIDSVVTDFDPNNISPETISILLCLIYMDESNFSSPGIFR